MSGVCGLVRLDGGPASTDQLAPIWNAMATRGPDGGGCWADERVALGFRLLATTHQSSLERLPFHHRESGCTIVADVRLDNRDELAASLNISPNGSGDGELILLAYLKWGTEAPLRLVGDFAFAIWDARTKRLYAARDPVGMRQLHYAYLPGQLFAFATDDHAVAAHPGVPRALNETRIADFLEDLEGADLTSTFLASVSRLAPAHSLDLSSETLTLKRFWSPQPQDPLKLSSDVDYASAFLHHLEQAVGCRLQSSTGAMLSGGLDSSSIVAVASRLRQGQPLPTFSAVNSAASDCEETAMSRLVQALPGVRPFEVDVQDAHSFADRLLPSLTQNPFDRTMALVAAVYDAAAGQQLNLVLDGASADVVLAHRNHNARLLRQGRLMTAWGEAQGQSRFWRGGSSPSRLLFADARAAFTPQWARSLKQSSVIGMERLTATSDVLRPEFARRIDIAGRRHLLAQASPSPSLPYQDDRAGIVLHNNLVVARERYDRVASRFGIEARDPFVDLRLVKFALSLPGEQLVRLGWPKYILRGAMESLLPEQVRWRRGKAHLGAGFNEAIRADADPVARLALSQRSDLGLWVKPEILSAAASTTVAAVDRPAARVRFLAEWLKERDR